MTTWHEVLQKHGSLPAWPYPIRYGKERVLRTDVLILGGGIAGSHAAINARRRGVQVTVMEKCASKWSGNGGAGVDHWLSACTNPCSTVSPEDFTRRILADCGGYDCGPLRYINAREGWDALLDCERMGMQIRDTKGQFEGAAFRDNDTGLLFAYDYESRIDLRVYGHNVKPCLHQEMKRLGVQLLDRVMLTTLLTAESERGTRVVGAMGLHTRTGELVVVQAKATVLATGLPGRLWLFSTENRPTFRDPNLTAEGAAAAWNAGAAFALLETSYPDPSPMGYLAYGVGNAHNTWHGCSIVDANGVEVPWVDRDGVEFNGIEDRFRPSPDQDYTVGHGLRVPPSYENHVRELTPDLPERIRAGEFVLPLYADLTRLPAHERRAIFGLMVGNEGKTRIPVYDMLTKAGFDPDCDLLQAPVMPPEAYSHANFWSGLPHPQWHQWGSGGVVVDWDLKTNLEGFFAAGGAIFGAGAHSSAAASGRYAGRKAAHFAQAAPDEEIDSMQIEREKARVYAPLQDPGRDVLGWKELNAGICRVMQDCCGAARSRETLEQGLRLLEGLRESEAARTFAANPHELARTVECLSLLTAGEAVIHASLAREASSELLGFQRLDFPEVDPPAWEKLVTIRRARKGVEVEKLPLDVHLQTPNAASYEENYRLHAGLDDAGEGGGR